MLVQEGLTHPLENAGGLVACLGDAEKKNSATRISVNNEMEVRTFCNPPLPGHE